MLIVTSFPASAGEPSASPFGVKAMCLLSLSGLDWQFDPQPDPRKAPKGKFPILHDGDLHIPDSESMRTHLEARTGKDFDAGLTSDQRAISRAVIRMVDEHMYFLLYADRWMNDAVWSQIRQSAFNDVPSPMRGLVARFVRKGAIRQLHAQGTGRHSEGERLARARMDLDALDVLLSDKPFLFGDTPTAADCSAVPMVNALQAGTMTTKLSTLARTYKRLQDYALRGRDALYPKGS